MLKIVVLDGYTTNPGDLSWDGIGELGMLTVYDRTDAPETALRIGDARAVFTNKVVIGADVMDACPEMKFIGVLATGYNVVDVAAAHERGITVCNIPAYSTPSVAQLTFSLLLDICFHAARHSDSVHAGKWAACPDFCYWETPLIELAGRTLGIIGYGRIGQAVSRIASAFGMNVLCNSRRRSCRELPANCRYADLEEIFKMSDVISLHCPLHEGTQGIICRENIAKMKDGVIILNTGRGPLVKEQDLADALNSGKVYAAGVDVVSAEPIRADNPLLTAKNCVITPHIAWAPEASRRRLMEVAADNLKAWIDGCPVNVVG
jgi:glycerate dehydrogenase